MSDLPMLVMCGRVANVFLNPDSINRETGEVREGKYKVQLLCNVPLKNGQAKLDVQTLSTDQHEVFEGLVGKMIRLPIGAFVMGKSVGFYALAGTQPEVL